MAQTNTALKADIKAEETTEEVKLKRDFAIIRMGGKRSKQDSTLVPVRVTGETIRMKRGSYIPVKAKFVHALRNALEPITEEDDGSGSTQQIRRRKTVDYSPRYPFELFGWIDEKNYNRLRKIALKREITEWEVNEVC